jgi:hypothetical protein
MAEVSKKRKRAIAKVDAEKAYPLDPPPPDPKPWWQFWKTTNNDFNNYKEESIAIDISDKKK